MRRLDLLQNAVLFITQCAHYYKMPQSLLRNASLLQNAAEQSSLSDESIRVVVLYLARIYDRATAGQCKRRVPDVYKGEFNYIKVHSSKTINPKYLAFRESS